MKVFQLKSPTENVSILLGFGDYLAEGETLSSPSLSVRALNSLDVNPSARFSTPTVVGEDVYILMTGGVLGEDYEGVCQVTTSNSQKLELAFIQMVRDIRDT